MTTTVTLLDGRRYGGATPEAAVTAMWQDAPFAKAPTLADYMAGVAWRVAQWNGHTVRTDDAATFLRDMADAGVLTLGRGD